MLLLRGTGEDLVGKHAVVIGQSNIVGRPMALELLMARCTVTVCHSATRDLPAIVASADIVVAAMGKLRFVQGAWIKPGAIVIDTTVPLAACVGGRSTRTLGVWQGSAAQEAAELVPPGVTVVAAFHNASAELLTAEGPVDCDVIVCSDDPASTQVVQALAAKIPGIRAIDGGKLENARIVEQITALLIALNIRHKAHSGIRITGLPAASYREG